MARISQYGFTSRTSLLLILSSLFAVCTAQKCSCYTTNSSAPYTSQTYQHYTFLDFRSLTPTSRTYAGSNEPAKVKSDQDQGLEQTTDPYFNSSAFTDVWQIQNWMQNASATDFTVSTFDTVNSAQNLYICQCLVPPLFSPEKD